jgi:hypothetical protein
MKACKLPDTSTESQLHEAIAKTHSSFLDETVSNCQSPDGVKTVEMKVQTLYDNVSDVRSSEAAESLTVSQPHDMLNFSCENQFVDLSAQGSDSDFHIGSKSDVWQSFAAASSPKIPDAFCAYETGSVSESVSGRRLDIHSSVNTSTESMSQEPTNTTNPTLTSAFSSHPSSQILDVAQIPLVPPANETDHLVNQLNSNAAAFDVVVHADSDISNRNMSVFETSASSPASATATDTDRNMSCSSPPVGGCDDLVDWSADLESTAGNRSSELVHLRSPADGVTDFADSPAGDNLLSNFTVHHSAPDTNSNQASGSAEVYTNNSLSCSDAINDLTCHWPIAVQREKAGEELPFTTETTEAHTMNIADEPTVTHADCLSLFDLNMSSTWQCADTSVIRDEYENSGSALTLQPRVTAVCSESAEIEVPDVEQHPVVEPMNAFSGIRQCDFALVTESWRHGDYHEYEDADNADLPDGALRYVHIGLSFYVWVRRD